MVLCIFIVECIAFNCIVNMHKLNCHQVKTGSNITFNRPKCHILIKMSKCLLSVLYQQCCSDYISLTKLTWQVRGTTLLCKGMISVAQNAKADHLIIDYIYCILVNIFLHFFILQKFCILLIILLVTGADV